MIHQFKTDRELIGVMLDKDAHDIGLYKSENSGRALIVYSAIYQGSIQRLKYFLPEGNYHIFIPDVSRATEEEAAKIVESSKFYTSYFKNYMREDSSHKSDQPTTALESLATLLEREKMYSENPFFEEPDEMDLDRYPLPICFDKDEERRELYRRKNDIKDEYELWQEAEFRTGVWSIIEKIS